MKWSTNFVLAVLMIGLNGFSFAQQKSDGCELTASYAVKHAHGDQSNGEITLTLKSEVRPVFVLWSSFEFKSESENIKGLKPGFYSVIIRDAKGCMHQIDNIEVKSNITN
jgi:hypothetical protein